MRHLTKSVWVLSLIVMTGLALVRCLPHRSSGKTLGTMESSQTWVIQEDTRLRIPRLGPVPPLPEWPDNPATEAKKQLGQTIYFDARLSGSGTMVCGGCHPATTDFQSSTATDLPDRSYPNLSPSLTRNAPSLWNLVYAPMLRWDGSHFTDLYDAMVLPFAEANMNLSKGIPSEHVEVVDVASAQETLRTKFTQEIPGYIPLFKEAFGVEIDQLSAAEIWRLTGKAMAVYIRVAVSRDAAFDRWNAGDDSAISDAAKRGVDLFVGKAGCIACHNGPMFSDYDFHNMSTSLPGSSGKRPDEGRFLVTGREEDRGAFLTPTLRSVARSSPYFHTGTVGSIAKVIKHITGPTATLDPLHDVLLDDPVALSDSEIADLVAFMKTLDGKAVPRSELKGPLSFP